MSAHVVRQLLGARLTIAVVLVWLVIELGKFISFTNSDSFFLHLGLSRLGMESLLLWQPVSYAFVHGGWVHVLMNVLLLLGVGCKLEWMLGRATLGVVLLAGLLTGAAFHLVTSSHVLVGGSGAVFAALLCMATLSPESRWLVPFPISAKNLGRGLMASFLILMLLNPEFGLPGLSKMGAAMVDAGWSQLFSISHACHLGGALAGWLGARWILRNRVTLESLQRDRARRESGLLD